MMTTTLPPGTFDPILGVDDVGDPTGAHPRFVERRDAVQLENLRHRNKKVLVGCAFAVLVLFGFSLTQGPLLDVDEVAVNGARTLDIGAIVSLSEVVPGDALLGLDLGLIEDRLEIVPNVAAATVSKGWGGVVTIDLVERVPTVQFKNGETWIVTGADGIVIAHEDAPRPGVPGVRGALFQTVPGRRVPAEVNVSLSVAAAMPADVAAVVETITQTADSLILDLHGGAVIELGDARNLAEKFAAARAFLAHVELRCVDVINVQAPTVPVVVRSDYC